MTQGKRLVIPNPTDGSVWPTIKLKPRERWFAHRCREAEDGWCGPHKTIEAALSDIIGNDPNYEYGAPIFVAVGRRLKKEESEQFAVPYGWECDTPNALKVFPPAR